MPAEPHSSVREGDILVDRYQLDRFVAAGAMGEVYEATDRSLGRRVAIKVALQRAKLTAELERRLLTEARAAAKLRGTHVAHIFEIGRLDDGTPFVVMEFLEGETLEDVLQARGRVKVADAIHWALQCCLALAEAHAQGIVHRDIKPDNLFLAETPDGDVVLKVLDFGASAFIASQWAGTRSSKMHVGTPLYMAPERIEEPQSSDRRSDIWALGAVFYELVIGHAPFDDEDATVEDVIDRTLLTEPEPLHALHPGIHERLSRVIHRCLEKDLDKRYGDVAAVARDLAAFGRPGAHQIAARVARVWAKAQSRPPVRQPVASSTVPKARPKLPTAPILLTGETLEPFEEIPDTPEISEEASERKRRTLPRPKGKRPKTVPPPRRQLGSAPLLLTRKKDD